MSSSHAPGSLEAELAQLEAAGRNASIAIANARNVREAIAAAEVEVPHHLIAISRVKVPTIGRLKRVRDLRIEDIVKDQLAGLQNERSDLVCSRELDRLKASDWSALRTENPDLYSKAIYQGNMILERLRKTKR